MELRTSGPINLSGLRSGERRIVTLGVDFGDSGRVSEWIAEWRQAAASATSAKDVGAISKSFSMRLEAPFGEQIEAVELDAGEFTKQRAQLGGMHQIKARLKRPDHFGAKELYKIANCKQVKELKVSY